MTARDVRVGFDAGQRLVPIGEGAHLMMARRQHPADQIGRGATGLDQDDAHDVTAKYRWTMAPEPKGLYLSER